MSIVVESRTGLEFTWDPADVLPLADDPDSFLVDVDVYAFIYRDKKWELQFKKESIRNNGHATLNAAPFTSAKDMVRATCIFIKASEYRQNDITRGLIEELYSNSIHFPSGAGIWSGLMFSIDTDIGKMDEERKRKFEAACSAWQAEKIPEDVVNSLPACPPTEDRARLPNSGLEEVTYESALSNTNYHSQWMSVFHPEASVCFAQAIVAR